MTDNTHFPGRVWLYPNGDLCRRAPVYEWEAQSYVRSDLYDVERSAKTPTLVVETICRLGAEIARLRAENAAAYQRGAEAMREAASWAAHDWAMGDKRETFPHDVISALPIPDMGGARRERLSRLGMRRLRRKMGEPRLPRGDVASRRVRYLRAEGQRHRTARFRAPAR